jgi:hypothetical protein
MKQKIIRILFFLNLTIVGIALGLSFARPISPGLILTGIGTLCAAIICGMEINKENKKKENL